ncbi:RHS repeat-associated core domain-containing protein [Spirilliplanes yamanashiensis]|uniref:Hint domain-containing protein n=1 Tax=Spirilliplanes yamanashiensis TaxID=42233 RepID=A0A8J3Y4N8_9ACTN|nr:RHS repeat-associated core domain-containing protein [Spirilliplanes yamanashiensis]MDP9819866.1 RHS repeat-associated protein [Spirilliplanes yamanashiensis]GIJ01315.1 hypothetical protein Sya03_06670 [Spirilliplanes yamanashiensis]
MRTGRRALTLTLAALVTATLGITGPARAEDPVDEAAREARRPKTVEMESTPVVGVPLDPPLAVEPAPEPGPVTWPAAGAATVTLPAPLKGLRALAAEGPGTQAGDLPIRIGSPAEPAPPGVPPSDGRPGAGADVPGKVRVEVLDRATAERAGVDDGLLLSVARADGRTTTGEVGLEVDYTRFGHAVGGNWADRLVVKSLPGCALTTPDRPECRVATPLPTRNNLEKRRLVADVAAPAPAPATGARALAAGRAGLLSVSAGASGSTGTFAATSLAPSGSWQHAGNSGGFSWQYPLRVPPALAGPSPQLAFTYSSASVDGRTGSTNAQPSWIGEGFDMNVGFIERSYRSCKDDGHDERGEEKYDLCWAGDKLTMSFGSRNGELVKKADNEWRLKTDDGTRIVRKTGGFNDDNNDEYFVVTTTDGTQFHFGKGKRTAEDTTNTNSSWEVPVYGDDDNEPCHGDSFKESRCKQTWRWNLDYVVDTHGNTSTYYYGTETNRYGANRDDVSVAYDRGGHLKRIEYGERKGEENDTRAPAQVVFTVAERCKGEAADCEDKDLDEDSAKRWPDVPEDQICTDEDSCEDQWSPTFFTRKRLDRVTTQVLDGADYRDVDVWGLEQSYPDPADASTAGLWLDAITHTGKGKGGDITLPKTTFQRIGLDNRVDRDGDDRLPYTKYRIRAIQSESGGIVSVNYRPAECTASEKRDPATNTKRCYPSFWSSQGTAGEKEDWFHTYVVDSVVEDDRTDDGVDKVTSYLYDKDGVAWHYDDNELTKAKKKTWSQNRGYRKVRTITGAAGSVQLETESTYLRGMDGDRKGDSTEDGYKDVAETATDGTRVADDNRLQGFLLEQRTLRGVGGPEVSGLVNTPWLSAPTATEGGDKARLTGIAKTVARTAVTGAAKPRTTSITHHYDDDHGMLDWSSDAGDTDVAGDESCTRTWYARNPGINLLTLVSRVQTVAVPCDRTPSFPADHISDVRTAYDGKDVGEAPTKGDVTRSEQLTSFSGGKAGYEKVSTSQYDRYGRLRYSWDAEDNRTETAYVPASGGPVIGMTVVNPLGHTVTSTVDPAWGLVTATTETNDQTTNLQYDGLGRLRKVWLAGRDPKNDVPDIAHDYTIRTDGPVAVTTRTLTPNDGIRVKQALYDGLLRPRQNQEASPKTGRLITSTEYDSRGLAITRVGPFHNAADPGTDLVDTGASTEGVPTRTETVYDGAGRATDEIFVVAGEEKWRTRTTYFGDRTSVDPPTGDTPVTVHTNAQGLTTKLLEYKGTEPTGEADTTVYSYDKADRLEKVKDAAGNVWSYGYDLLGRQTSAQDPDAGSLSQTFTSLDEVETSTDGRGRTLRYTYDDISRPTLLEEQTTKPDGTRSLTKLASWTYDTAKLGEGRPATSTRWVGANAYTTAVTEYDVAGRAKTNTVTIPAVENKLAGTYTASATYRIDGSPDSTTLPKAGDLPEETVRTGYNSYGLPSFLGSGTSYVRNTTYTRLGEVEQLTLGTSSASKYTWLTYAYERGTRRLHNVMVDREAVTGNDANVTYEYDAAGNTRRIADTPTTAGSKVDVQCFQYDYLRRLKEAWAQGKDGCAAAPAQSALGGPAPYWQTFGYTVSGDRETEVNHAVNATATEVRKTYHPYGVNRKPAHAVERTDVATVAGGKTVTTADTYAYDGAGNMTRRKLGANPEETYGWDAEGRLAEVKKAGTTTATFLYDAAGQRLIRRDLAGKSVTLYLGDTEIKLDTSVADVTKQKVTATRYYSFGGQAVAMRTAAGVTWLAGGQNGTAEIAINASTSAIVQRRTLPFGGVRGTAGTWPGEKGFVGGAIDAVSGLTHLGARQYDPSTGRFISVDPIIDFTDPQQLNAYTYGRNNPFAFPDPSGLWWGWSNVGHAALDIVGLIPVVGEAADVVNGVWYLAEKDYVNAGLSFASAIPLAGYAATAAKGAKYVDEAVEAADTVSDVAKTTDKASDAGKAADNVTPPATPKPNPAPKPAPPAKPKDPPKGAKDTSPGKPEGKPDAGKSDGKGKSDGGGSCKTDNSFVPGTLVVLADGSTKPIEELVAGQDEVRATDPETGVTEAKAVEATITGEGAKQLVDVVVDTGDGQSVIVATDNHPFWVADEKAWVDAGELRVGALLRTAAGTYVQVEAVDPRPIAEARVHNLTVEDTHTYYVVAGDTPVLVHNCNGVVSSEKTQAQNQAEIDAQPEGYGFTGVYDTRSGAFEMQLSSGPDALVSQRGGHGTINNSRFGGSRMTIGFVAIVRQGGLEMRWNSISVNVRNLGTRAAPEIHRGPIMDAVRRATGREVWG